jgi:hypothetical protein
MLKDGRDPTPVEVDMSILEEIWQWLTCIEGKAAFFTF